MTEGLKFMNLTRYRTDLICANLLKIWCHMSIIYDRLMLKFNNICILVYPIAANLQPNKKKRRPIVCPNLKLICHT